jgi:hypothetical protein
MESDKVILHTIDSYLRHMGASQNISPDAQLVMIQNARDYLYSEIAQRIPNVAPKILSADLEINDQARALFLALYDHAMDPIFVKIMMNYLGSINRNNQNQGALLSAGALLVRILDKYYLDNAPVKDKDSKKDSKKDPKKEGEEKLETISKNHEQIDASKVKHIQEAIDILLGDVANKITMRCGNITYPEALFIASCISANNESTITELIKSDLPITADVFDIILNKNEIMKSALLLEKKDFTKLTANQQKFVESLQRWVFDKLNNNCTTNQCYSFLVSIYGLRPDTNKYLINVRDCGTTYSNLLQVARLITN